jgi:hypothetical protein
MCLPSLKIDLQAGVRVRNHGAWCGVRHAAEREDASEIDESCDSTSICYSFAVVKSFTCVLSFQFSSSELDVIELAQITWRCEPLAVGACSPAFFDPPPLAPGQGC